MFILLKEWKTFDSKHHLEVKRCSWFTCILLFLECISMTSMDHKKLPWHVPAGVIIPMMVVPPFDVTLIRSLALAISFLLFLFRLNHVPRNLLLLCKV
jgi:hypothetical protein